MEMCKWYKGKRKMRKKVQEHDIDRETAKKNVHPLKEFNTGGWERLWNIEFPV